uniref:Family with sequence similarity 50 member A n=1 Tax=Naja naja TaxID=35670 RepID=A0A8C6YFJ3_NAJNA
MAQYKGAASEAGRALQLMKKRERQREHMEQMRQRIAEENIMKSNIDKKFSAHYDAVEAELKSSTVENWNGCGSGNASRNKNVRSQACPSLWTKRRKMMLRKKMKKQNWNEKSCLPKRRNLGRTQMWTLASSLTVTGRYELLVLQVMLISSHKLQQSRVMDADSYTSPKSGGPQIASSFSLPHPGFQEEENRLREELRQEWEAKQEKIKSEEIEITFSYWDGSGHRRTVKMKKGNTIQQFLQKALEILRKDFSELRSAGVEQLMYIKEDLIIPHHHSFYDFIVTKARGKSGPLFNFDVHDDVRLLSDATVEKDESHAGKVVLRSWYEKNKHIFPASRWEPYDPEKKWDKYTIR